MGGQENRRGCVSRPTLEATAIKAAHNGFDELSFHTTQWLLEPQVHSKLSGEFQLSEGFGATSAGHL